MKVVVPTANTLAMLCGFLLISTFQTRKWIRKDVLLVMVAGAVIGTVLGTYILASYKSDLLKRILGFLISGYSLRMLFRGRDSGRELKNYIGGIAGFVSGCLGGTFSMGGPPVIMYLNRKIKDKNSFRATLILYFLATNLWQFITFCYAGLINRDVLRFTLYLLPAFIIGNLAGSVLHIKIDQVLFDRIVALVLLITGISLVF